MNSTNKPICIADSLRAKARRPRTPLPIRCGGCGHIVSYSFREQEANAGLEFCPTCAVSLLVMERALLLKEIPEPEVALRAAVEAANWQQFVEYYAGKKET